MKIAVISDTHDNVPNTRKALEYINARGIEVLIHCGDVSAGSMMVEIAKKFTGQIHMIFGNVHADKNAMHKKAEPFKHLTLHGDQAEIEIDGKKIAVNHFPDQAKELAESGNFDTVFYGHTHKPWEEKIGECMMRNPGTVAGMFSKATFAIHDTQTNKAELILIEKI